MEVLNYQVEHIPTVSIVSSIYDMVGYANLKSLVASIERQSRRDLELVIVIERERGGYRQLKEYLQDVTSFPTTIIYSNQSLGIAKSRNLGANNCRGRIISFVDDDAQLLGDWVGELVGAFSRHPKAIGVTGPSLPDWENPQDRWFPQELFWVIGCSAWKALETEGESQYAWGVNMSFKREVFVRSVFSDAFTPGSKAAGKSGPVGDDIDFSLRAKRATGGTIIFNPNLRVLHRVPTYKTSMLFVRKYAYWQGFSDARFKGINRASLARLTVELQALKSIIVNFLPDTARLLFSNTRVAGQRSSIMLQAMVSFSAGYAAYVLRN